MINPIWLISFVEVVHRKTMAGAAKHLRITPAAISKHILMLENALGIPLLKRSTRHLEMTAEGEIYFDHAKQILESYENAEAAISHSKEEPTGTLKIVCGPHMGNLYVLPHMKEFLERYPKLRLNFVFTQTMPDLEKEKIDVVVGLSDDIPSNCIQRKLIYARWTFCASPEYLKKFGEPKTPADLANHHIITRIQRQPNNVIKFQTGHTITFEPYLYFNDTRAMRRAALHGLGIAQLHDYVVEQDFKENRLVEILKKYQEKKQSIPILISYLQSSHVHIKIRKFVDFMVEVTSRTKKCF